MHKWMRVFTLILLLLLLPVMSVSAAETEAVDIPERNWWWLPTGSIRTGSLTVIR